MTSCKLQNHEFQIKVRYLSIGIYSYCVNRELCFCTKHSFINVCQKRQKCHFGVLPVSDKNVALALKGLTAILIWRPSNVWAKPVVNIILIYDWLNLWRHRQFITIFYQFLLIRIEIIHGSHMHILFLPRVGLYVNFLPLAVARGKTSWHRGLPVVKTIYTYGFHELFLKQSTSYFYSPAQPYQPWHAHRR